ncbi:MAG: type IV secretion system DNA-binding domain-containing protein [Planctomycetota bacterium]|nr:type IV secretion system DNA-binding domain-containing protein [Planctomycetota bacterium]
MQADYEKLGIFYLGKTYDIASRKRDEVPLLYESQDLVTHAVCVGMTGSGKTGLCVNLLEEAAIDGIPAIVIDPKGDLTNLLLQFPNLTANDFAAWVDPDEARRNGMDSAAFAEKEAAKWKAGLEGWQQDGARIQRLKDSAEFNIYTPGSNAGIPVSILRSFSAPPQAVVDDTELFQGRVSSTATSLLGLIGVDADPVQSREHILLSNILDRAWREGRDLDLAGLIGAIQSPPLQRIGVFELEAFFASKDRFALAMRLNNLLASPSFSNWLEGEGLDINRALWTETGKPKISIFSIAHLSDPERMFFVSLLLNQTLSWMRTQSGTSSLRAILYMDEIFGYFPPVANPPSKQPLLTLLKQARAFGLGIMLATQNPVDLDYKGLANCGTWFIGRLQTERDKARLLDGLEGASQSAGGGFDRSKMDEVLGGLGKRVFLLNNIHAKGPVVFETRWAMSYLRGPLTREQVKSLMDKRRPPKAAPVASSTSAGAGSSGSTTTERTLSAAKPTSSAAAKPVLPPDISQYFKNGTPANSALTPALLGCAKVYFNDTKTGVATEIGTNLLAPFTDGPAVIDWEDAEEVELDETKLSPAAPDGASYAPLPAVALKPKSYDAWKKALVDNLARTEELHLFRCDELDLLSKPFEPERDFRIRLTQKARETKDREKERLRTKYAPKRAALEERLRKAQQAVQREAAQARDSKVGAAISFGSAILGAFFGKKAVNANSMSRTTTGIRGVGKAMRDSGDVDRAEETVEAIGARITELDAAVEAEFGAMDSRFDPETTLLEDIVLKPKKTNVTVRFVGLVWIA